jgi:hypothetical protein
MGGLTAIVLGSAAGGGFPQWNCRCPACELAWKKDPRVTPRTQTSLAVSADGRRWTLLNASPDLRQQIQTAPALQPRALRSSPIEAAVLTGGEIDQPAVAARRHVVCALCHTRDPGRARGQCDVLSDPRNAPRDCEFRHYD